jgi:hypothetical protein
MGSMPATIAMVVIRMAAGTVRLDSAVPVDAFRPQGVGVVDLQDRVLLHDAEQHHQPDGAVTLIVMLNT